MHAEYLRRFTAPVLAGVVFCALRPLHGQDAGVPDAPMIRIHIELPQEAFDGIAETERAIYFASNLNGWNPGAQQCAPITAANGTGGEEAESAWRSHIDLLWNEATRAAEFKVTRGSWETVEVAGDGRDIANRAIRELEPLKPFDSAFVMEYRIVVPAFADQRSTRFKELQMPGEQSTPRASTVTGVLEVLHVQSEVLGNRRPVRIWLPPGYSDEVNATTRYPVLYMHDGQNLFDEATSFLGVEWSADETATMLIQSGEIPPMIIVGIDNAGQDRAREYNPPYTQFQGRQNHGDRYVHFVTEELMPLIEKKYRIQRGPEYTSMGGSSFGGNATLYAAMARPGLFGRILVESPASWICDGALVKAVSEHHQWPDRIYLGMGSKEYDRAEDDLRLVGLLRGLEAIFRSQGLDDTRLLAVVEQDAAHNEAAWARRLPEAMRFLYGRRDDGDGR